MAAHAVSCRLRGARPRFLVLLCERSSLLVLLMFLQEETKPHSPLTCVDLKSNEIHLLLMKTMTLDRVGVRVGSVGGLSPDRAPPAPPPRVHGPAEPQTAVFADVRPLLASLLDG